jgi:hypothetical protein
MVCGAVSLETKTSRSTRFRNMEALNGDSEDWVDPVMVGFQNELLRSPINEGAIDSDPRELRPRSSNIGAFSGP